MGAFWDGAERVGYPLGMAQCSAKSGKHRSAKAQQACPVHKASPWSPQPLAKTPFAAGVANPSSAVGAGRGGGLPVKRASEHEFPQEGFHNIGFDECGDFGDVSLGVIRTPWAGTVFEDCEFPYGLMAKNGNGDSGVRITAINCNFSGICVVGRKGRIEGGRVDGRLTLGEESAARGTSVKEALHISTRARAEDMVVEGVVSIADGARFSTQAPMPQGVQVNGQYEADGPNALSIALGRGGVVWLGPYALTDGVTIEGDRQRTVVMREGRNAFSEAVAALRYAAATQRAQDDPRWVAADNERLWEFLFETCGVDPLSTTYDTIPEESLLLGLLIHRNP